MSRLRDLFSKLKDQYKSPVNLATVDPKVAAAAMRPHYEVAVRQATSFAISMLVRKFRASGLHNDKGTLLNAIKRCFLKLTWKGNNPVITLSMPVGMPDSFYKRVWSLDHGYTNHGKHVKAHNFFTLSKAEKNQLSIYIQNLAAASYGRR